MTAMFESVDQLSRTLPRPALTGDHARDARAIDIHRANSAKLRNEAVRSLFSSL
jgi:hypothetical protein